MALSIPEKRLTKRFIQVRIFIVLIVVPFFRIFFERFDYADDKDMSFIEKVIEPFDVFDSVQFRHVADKGYQAEINHAFFPFFPFVVKSIASTTGMSTLVCGFLFQLAISYANMLLIYRVGLKVITT